MEITRNSLSDAFEVGLNGRLVFSENGQFREVVEELGHHQGKLLGPLDIPLHLSVVAGVSLELLPLQLSLSILVAVQSNLGPAVGNIINFLQIS